MRVKEIEVKSLFGIFDHKIEIKMQDRITIIHGPNGYGKTVLLKMLSGLFNSSYSHLRTIPFHTFQVSFDNKSTLRVTKSDTSEPDRTTHGRSRTAVKREPPKLTVTLSRTGTKSQSFVLPSPQSRPGVGLNRRFRMLEESIPGIERVGERLWRFHRTGELLDFDELVERFGHMFPELLGEAEDEPEWFKELTESISIKFIDTQRLLELAPSRYASASSSGPRMELTVEKYSQDLAKRIQSELAQYGTLSQALDRDFPKRLLQGEIEVTLSEDQLRIKLKELETKRERLRESGLLDRESAMALPAIKNIDESTKRVLEIYVKDVEQKLSYFDDIVIKLELFKRIINQRFLYKDLVINEERGFRFETSNHSYLPATRLSTGEQHEVILFYELLFNIDPGTFVLIDEPEISLHVAWQIEFLKDLQQVTKLSEFDVLIATHSPQIINDRWDLTVELQGPKS